MENTVQITFRDFERTPAIEAHVEERVRKLETFFDRLIGCHVTLEAPHRHRRHGRTYRVRVDLAVPGGDLVVGRAPDGNPRHEDLYAAIDDAFDDAGRVLQDHVRKQRGDTKTHESALHARVIKLFPTEGYGFLQTPEGDELYFHRNSVLHHAFDRMRIGTEVRYAEDVGERGPHASTVVVR